MALINNGQILGSGSTDLILNTRGKIYVKVGDRFYELDFKNEGNNRGSSIINNTTINNPEQDLSPYVTKKYLKAALGEYVTKRNWEDIMQTKDALENAKLEGFTESVTPITVNTMQMVVGTQNLQFDFITSLKDATVVSPGLYINESGQLVCPRGFIKHYTLFGPQSIKPETNIEYYARWAINGDDSGDYTLLDLEEKDKPYYVYLRVNTTGYKDITDDDVTQNLVDDPKGKNTGNWFASTQSYAIDEVEGYAYLLVALITGSNSGGRSIGYLNGFTEILPGQITAYVFKTADGNQYLDFLNNKFRIGNNDQYIDWNGENLNIKGSLSVIGGDLKDTLDNLQSQIDDEIQCWFSTDSGIKQHIPLPNKDNKTANPNWPANKPDWVNKDHIGDLYYVVEDDSSTQDINEQGQAYRYIKDGNLYYWTRIVDNSISLALYNAYLAQQTANNAQNILNDIANDNVITIQEHGQLRELLNSILAQCEQTIASADPYKNIQSVATAISNLNTKKDTLNTIVNEILNQTDTYTISEEYREAWNNVFEALKNLSTEIAKELNNQISEVSYIKEALKGRTDVTGGLVLTGLIELGFGLAKPDDENYYDSFRVMSGINGILGQKDGGKDYTYTDPAVWFGGDMLDLEDEKNWSKPEVYELLIKDNNEKYYKYIKGQDEPIETYLYKWKRKNDGSLYYSLTESGQPFVNSPYTDSPLQPISQQPSGNKYPFDKFIELMLDPIEFEYSSGNTLLLQGTIQAYRVEQTSGEYIVYNIKNKTTEILSGDFHKCIVSSHEQSSSNNAINLTGSNIFVYSLNGLAKGVFFNIGNTNYYIECNPTPKNITGFLYITGGASYPVVNVYERQDFETFPLYQWKYNNAYIYTLTDYTKKPDSVYLLSNNNIVQYAENYTVAGHFNNLAKSMFRMNGSGYLADGNISWDTDGKLIFGKGTMMIDPDGAVDLGYLHSDENSFWIGTENNKMLKVTANTCEINGSLHAKAKDYYSGSFVSVEDSSGTIIADIGSAPLSTAAIPTYLRQEESLEMFYKKGSIMWGKVSIPSNWEYQIIDWYKCFVDGEIYKLKDFNIHYEFCRVSKPITLEIVLRNREAFSSNNNDRPLFSATFNISKENQKGDITINNLISEIKEGIQMESFHEYSLIMKLSPGQVQSSAASDSWILIQRGAYEVEITRTSAQIQKGTFIRPNGISSVFGKNSKFQWLGAMSNQYKDYRDQGGTFIISLPAIEGGDNANEIIGLEITGYMNSSATRPNDSNTPGMRINLGGGWYKLKFDDNGILRKA